MTKELHMKNNKLHWITSMALLVWLMAGSTSLIAQSELEDELEDAAREVEDALREVEEELDGMNIHIDLGGKYRNGSPKLGLYLEDLDFEEVYERHYPNNYGVLVTGVVSGGNADRAGIIKNDIIMEFDGELVRFEEHLTNLRDSKAPGDSAAIKVFRNEKEFATSIYFVPPTPETDEYGAPLSEKAIGMMAKKKKTSVGYGGGGPMAIMIDLDNTNLNNFLTNNGFDPIGKNEMISFGGYGMGNIGNGWFIGGAGSGFLKTQQIPTKDASNVLTGYKNAKIEFGFGGVTISKKYALFTKRIVLDFSTLVGGGGMIITVGNTDGDFSWDNEIESMNSNLIKYQKEFFVVQPSVGLMIRLQNWVAVHGSVGYLGMFSSDDKWTDTEFEFTVDGDSPSLKDALSYNLGFWFGF